MPIPRTGTLRSGRFVSILNTCAVDCPGPLYSSLSLDKPRRLSFWASTLLRLLLPLWLTSRKGSINGASSSLTAFREDLRMYSYYLYCQPFMVEDLHHDIARSLHSRALRVRSLLCAKNPLEDYGNLLLLLPPRQLTQSAFWTQFPLLAFVYQLYSHPSSNFCCVR